MLNMCCDVVIDIRIQPAPLLRSETTQGWICLTFLFLIIIFIIYFSFFFSPSKFLERYQEKSPKVSLIQ